MCEGNYIKLNRKILEWGWYTDTNTFKLFLHLLLSANYKDGEFLGIQIKRGQALKSISKLSAETGLTSRNIRTAVDHLKATGEITCQPTRYGQLITVEKYALYQDFEGITDKKPTGNRQGSDNEPTGNRQRSDNILRRKECKEGKEGKNISPLPPLQHYGEYKHVKLTDEQYKKLVEDFGQDLTDGGIKAVDEYCEMNGKSYKNYALTIRKWGITRAREEGKKHGTGSGTETTPQQDYDDWYRRMAEIAGDVRRGSESGTDDFSG